MNPQPNEIEEVGNAFITLGYPDYTPLQHEYLTNFLKQYAQDLNENAMKEMFKDKIEVVDAIKTLHDFANVYQDEEIFLEFKEEVEDLITLLNDGQEGISF